MAARSPFPHFLVVMAAAPALGGQLIANSGVAILGVDAETAGGTLIGIGIALMGGVIAQIMQARRRAELTRTARPGCRQADSGRGASIRPR